MMTRKVLHGAQRQFREELERLCDYVILIWPEFEILPHLCHYEVDHDSMIPQPHILEHVLVYLLFRGGY